MDAQWFCYIRDFGWIKLPVIDRYLPNLHYTKRGFAWIELDLAPSTDYKFNK